MTNGMKIWCIIPRNRRCKGFFIFLLCAVLFIVINVLYYFYCYYTTFKVISEEDIIDNLVPLDLKRKDNICPLTNIDSHAELQYFSINNTFNKNTIGLSENTFEGGEWYPTQCTFRYFVAIVIPYRNRESHLNEFLYYIHPFLQRQNIHYKIYVIEQNNEKEFNRGKLFNIGFVEALKEKPYPCFIFHDVDLLPKNLKNIYACTRFPRHMAVGVDKYGSTLPYYSYFGGVISILSHQFKLVNGFSNEFYGWGGEDDDFLNRVLNTNLDVTRFTISVSRYYSLFHEQANPSHDRYEKLKKGSKLFENDGLNSLRYFVKQKVQNPTHVRIVVNI